ncbi:universal stress protein [Ovoidimarina sediminis]|uniref:universal stress protein n=1 Tax=Ovoidimarina sediminis TaxID=3079856 RepID=UPI002910F761|nr:universal stress protein [Rhodophyticola sp. MJ-SS7]MDU8945650.1 universal stress protein [Rhodophyticola sp. MJ-SS7]
MHTLLRLETDLAVDLGPVLVTVAREIGADVIVMASDRPDATGPVTGATEEYVARHAGCSVFVVR